MPSSLVSRICGSSIHPVEAAARKTLGRPDSTLRDRNAHNAGRRLPGMGLGSTAKKIQTVADTAEKMYRRLNALRKEVESTKRTVEDTGGKVETLETEIAEQRVILEAIGEELDIDIEAAVDDADLAVDGDGDAADSEEIPVEEGEASGESE